MDGSIEEIKRLVYDGNELVTMNEFKNTIIQLLDYIKKQDNASVPAGMIIPFSGNGTPDGRWLFCDGSRFMIKDYPELYAAIGDIFTRRGDYFPDPTDTFRIPDLRNRFVEGTVDNVAYVDAGLPNIKGSVYRIQAERGYNNAAQNAQGAFTIDNYGGRSDSGDGHDRAFHLYFDASRSNAIYGKSNTVQPPALKAKYYIKY